MISGAARPDNSQELNGIAVVEQGFNQCNQQEDKKKWKKRTLILLFMLVLGIIGIVFLGVGIGLCIRGRKKRSTCTELVTATVVDMQRERVGIGDSSASGEVRLKSWFPVYEYTVDGVKQRVKALIGTAQPERQVGETVELFVNPDRTNEFYCLTEKRLWIQNVFIVVGAVCLCLAGITGTVLLRLCVHIKKGFSCLRWSGKSFLLLRRWRGNGRRYIR